MSRSRWKAASSGGLEIGWISTADIFVLLCCILFIGAIAAKRAKDVVEPLAIAEPVLSPDSLRTELGELQLTLEAMQASDESRVSELLTMKSKIELLENERSAFSQSMAARDSQITTLKKGVEQSVQKAKIATDELDMLKKKSAADILPQAQKRFNNQLLGLGGDLRRVAIIVDISNSMQGASFKGASYWDLTKSTIDRWVNSLDVEEAALIFFGNDARIALPMSKLDADHRDAISKTANAAQPTDRLTNFLAAFRLAFTIEDIDTIIVFSDGLPSVDLQGNEIVGPGGKKAKESDQAFRARIDQVLKNNIEKVLDVHREIVAQIRSHPNVAVNAVGLGDKVYSPHTGNLLSELALQSGGVFIAIPGPTAK